VIELDPIASALGSAKLAALLAFLALSGADISVGGFLVRENLRALKHFEMQTKMSYIVSFVEPWNHAASSRGDSDTCGEVCLPAFSA